jgi:uncharacterized protein YkvS
MGYKEGVTVITPINSNFKDTLSSSQTSVAYFKSTDSIYYKGYEVYRNGKFAEIIKYPKRSIYDVKAGDTIFKEEFSGIVDAVFENSLIVIWQNGNGNAKLNSKDFLFKNGWEIKQ